MAHRQFQEFNFRQATLAKIHEANEIIQEYTAQGFQLTIRQLYYQFVARDWLENSERSYKRMINIIANARLAGLVDWSAIEDRTRNLESNPHWGSPSSIIRAAANGFQIDKWADQPNRIEVWIEKEALAGVIAPTCERLDVDYFSCRGYVSLSEMYSAGRRLARYSDNGQDVYILHLGDHDPSGIDMTRDIEDRVTMLAERMVEIDRLALNWEQIEVFNPPPNFAKVTDSRSGPYIARHGNSSWELDALDPVTLSGIIEDAVVKLRDDDLWNDASAEEDEMREGLVKAADNWDDVAEYLGENHE